MNNFLNWTTLLPLALGLVSTFLAVKWQSSARENENLKQKLSEKKEKLYADFIKTYMDMVNKKLEGEAAAEKIREFNEKIMLVGSNKVVLTFGDLMQTIYNDPKETKNLMRLVGELILTMREDLGNKDFINSLYWFDTLRPWLKDINDYIPEKYRGLRRLYNRQVNTPK